MDFKVGEKVNLIIEKETDLGFVVLINDLAEGLLYHSDIFQPLYEGEHIDGYIKKLREDGLIDVSLKPQGYKNVIEINAIAILDKLNANDGFLPLHDKSSPEEIEQTFHMSKKAFKAAVGFLYKSKQIVLAENGIHLN
jgi:predicted RNA-binding protein (virulence factor B family)